MVSDRILAARWPLTTDQTQTAVDAELKLTIAGPSATVPTDAGDMTETAFSTDNRSLVPPSSFADGGKYRSIVKLQVQFEGDASQWAMATGWLIQEDYLVTAGHVAYDHSRKLGRAVRIRAYIGYNGKNSIGQSGVQFRQGAEIVTTAGWLASPQNRLNDVAFVRLDRKFTGRLNLISYKATPVKNQEVLGVVGYPADKSLDGEYGAQMYQEYGTVQYDLATAPDHMLEYTISTYAGNSGSPVLRQLANDSGGLDSIAAHTYGGYLRNSGGPIAGVYGNPYSAYMDAFDPDLQIVKTVGIINYISVEYTHGAEFSFNDILGVVSSFGGAASTVLNAAAPFLGPVAGPAAAIAGSALGAASHIGESSLGPESAVTTIDDYTGFVQRGILAESVLATIFDLPTRTFNSLGLNEKLEEAYNAVGPFGYGLGHGILPIVMQPAIAVGVDANRKDTLVIDRLKSGQTESAPSPQPLTHPDVSEAADAQISDFLGKMWKDTIEAADEDWFFNRLGQVIYDGVLTDRTCTTYGPRGLNLLSSLMAGKGIDAPKDDTETDLHALELRALFGEAALRAVIACDHDKLEQEGCFDTIKQYAQKIGRQAMQAADWVLPRVAPIVAQLIAGEAAVPAPPAAAGGDSGSAARQASILGLGHQAKGKDTSPGLDRVGQLVRKAALVAHEHESTTGPSGEETVRDALFKRLRSVNLDGVAFYTEP